MLTILAALACTVCIGRGRRILVEDDQAKDIARLQVDLEQSQGVPSELMMLSRLLLASGPVSGSSPTRATRQALSRNSAARAQLDDVSAFPDRKVAHDRHKDMFKFDSTVDAFRDEALQRLSAASLAVTLALSSHAALADDEVAKAVSRYAQVDKTGFIGGLANVIEQGVDLIAGGLNAAGNGNAYGLSILIITLLIRTLTLPVLKAQYESTAKMQMLSPITKKINAVYPSPNQQQQKALLQQQVFQAAQVNPLAGCLPPLLQLPIFLSLYRALTNLCAEDKLSEPFFWLPSLAGPVYGAPPSESLNWWTSFLAREPSLGWSDTAAFLSIPVILFVSQSISSSILQPARDPDTPMTEAEQTSQTIVKFLPFMIAFFSLNVPAGLALYWIASNVITTAFVTLVKAGINVEMPAAVKEIQDKLDKGEKIAINPGLQEQFDLLNGEAPTPKAPTPDEQPLSTSKTSVLEGNKVVTTIRRPGAVSPAIEVEATPVGDSVDAKSEESKGDVVEVEDVVDMRSQAKDSE
jgi:YidC/Oxa1 family membrane protein insertase